MPRTSTFALTNATLPWVSKLAKMGAQKAVEEDYHLRTALNAWKGKITHPGVAAAFDMSFEPAEALA